MQSNNSLMDEVTPLKFYLSQNYPNPFKEKTTIKYCVAYRTRVQLTVYDFEGKLVEKLVDEAKEAGTYKVEFFTRPSHESGNPEGRTYYYHLEAGDYKSQKRMILQC